MPPWSSGRPGDEPGAHSPSIWPCSGWGLAAAASPQPAGRSYRPISPLPTTRKPLAVCFCATFRLPRRTNPSAIAWALPSTLPGGARTFLPLRRNDAKSGHPVRTALHRQSSIGPYLGQMKPPPQGNRVLNSGCLVTRHSGESRNPEGSALVRSAMGQSGWIPAFAGMTLSGGEQAIIRANLRIRPPTPLHKESGAPKFRRP